MGQPLPQERLTRRQPRPAIAADMVDMFALSVAHGLLVLAGIRLFLRDDLDREGEAKKPFGGFRKARPVDDTDPRP